MPRARGGFKTRRRRKAVLEEAKGYYGAKSRLFKTATEAVDKALSYSYVDRKKKKRDFRSLWIVRINAAARALGLTYGQLIFGLKSAQVALDRKSLADMAYHDPAAFKSVADAARAKLPSA